MLKLTEKGEPTIGYVIELSKKDPSDLTKAEKRLLDSFSRDYFKSVIEPLQLNYKQIIFPAIENLEQFRSSYLNSIIDTQKYIQSFNNSVFEQLLPLTRLSKDISSAFNISANIAKELQSALSIQSNVINSLSNTIIKIPEFGKVISTQLDIYSSLRLTFNRLDYTDSILGSSRLMGEIQNITQVGLIKAEFSSNLEIKVQSLENKLDIISEENKKKLDEIYGIVKDINKPRDLFVIDEARYSKDIFGLVLRDIQIPIPHGSDQEIISKGMFKNTKNVCKEWDLDEIVEDIFHEHYDPADYKKWIARITTSVRHLNETIAINTSPYKDCLIFSRKTLYLNKELLHK